MRGGGRVGQPEALSAISTLYVFADKVGCQVLLATVGCNLTRGESWDKSVCPGKRGDGGGFDWQHGPQTKNIAAVQTGAGAVVAYSSSRALLFTAVLATKGMEDRGLKMFPIAAALRH